MISRLVSSLCLALPLATATTTAFSTYASFQRQTTTRLMSSSMSQADQERLLLSEPALNAFIVAEMRHFLTTTLEEMEKPYAKPRKWKLSSKEKLDLQLTNQDGQIISQEYANAKANMTGETAIDLLCNKTQSAFHDGYTNEQGLLSALGSAILFFKNSFRSSPSDLAACECIGLSDYNVAHHITDMYHHRCFRGAYTKTLAPSGKGEVAARIAVGLEVENDGSTDGEEDEEDECLLWSPTTPGVCLHWKSEDEAWRKRRFERIQMEGTRDPRRGGSGTTR